MTPRRHTLRSDTRAVSRRSLLGGTAGLAAGAAGAASLAGCGSSTAAGKVAIDYWLWDALQLPAYSAAIDRFMEKNPDIEVRITQLGFDDYWTKLTASFVAEAGPDAFTDHLARFPEFVKLGVITPLDGFAPVDELSASRFQDGLQDLWTGQDGKRYGVPKDYDTIAFAYDRRRLADSGVSEDDLYGLDWNPDDGGSFEQIIAHLSVDKNGVRGDEKGFDARNVATFGLAADPSIDYVGQTTWGSFALSTGWHWTDEPVWGTRFRFDDELFVKTIDWYFGLVDKGFFPPFGRFGDSSPATAQIQSGSAALAMTGSWMIGTFNRLEGVDLGLSPLPAGPIGHPVSVFNGLGDSISAQSQNKEEAARLIAFLASDEAQQLIGQRAPFFPATDVGTTATITSYEDDGLDVSAFTDRVTEGQTGLYPLVQNSASIMAIMQPAFDRIWQRQISGADFTEYNDKINALFS